MMRKIFLIFLFLSIGLIKADASSIETYPLTLDEVSRLALNNNFDIQMAKYDAYIARTDQMAAESIYDTILDMEASYRNDQSDRVSTIAGSKVRDHNYSVALSKKLPTGTTITLDASDHRSATDSSFSTLPTSHDANAGATIEQSLGRNFFGLQDRGTIKITRLDIENAEYTSLEKIENDLAEVQKAYWELGLAQQLVKIEESMVEEARKLFELYMEKSADGLAESAEVYAADANYRNRINQFHVAQNQEQTKINQLRILLNVDKDDKAIVAADGFILLPDDDAFDQALKQAFDHRRDYKKALNEVEAKGIQLSVKKNNLWPEINLEASFERNGISADFGEASEKITAEDNPDIYFGVKVSFPLENRSARSEFRSAKYEKAKSILGLKQVERKIAIGVKDRVRQNKVLKQVARDAQDIALIQEKKLQEELKSFNYGRSDTDKIIRFQEDVLTAKRSAAQAMFNYFVSNIELEQDKGTLLTPYWDGIL